MRSNTLLEKKEKCENDGKGKTVIPDSVSPGWWHESESPTPGIRVLGIKKGDCDTFLQPVRTETRP